MCENTCEKNGAPLSWTLSTIWGTASRDTHLWMADVMNKFYIYFVVGELIKFSRMPFTFAYLINVMWWIKAHTTLRYLCQTPLKTKIKFVRASNGIPRKFYPRACARVYAPCGYGMWIGTHTQHIYIRILHLCHILLPCGNIVLESI